MAGFIMKQMVGDKLNAAKGAVGGGDKAEGAGGDAKAAEGEDPEVVQARLEAEERRKDKHRRQEQDREKMREKIRGKYNIQKKEDAEDYYDCSGRIGGNHKTPEEIAAEKEYEESMSGQVGSALNKTKETLGGVMDGIKGFLPFGK